MVASLRSAQEAEAHVTPFASHVNHTPHVSLADARYAPPSLGFAEGGTAWFMNLGAADPTGALVYAAGVGLGALMHVGLDGMQMDQPPWMKQLMTFGLPVISCWAMMDLPAGVMLYFACTNVFSIGQSVAMRSPGVKRYFDIPEVPAKLLQVSGWGAPLMSSSCPYFKVDLAISPSMIPSTPAPRRIA